METVKSCSNACQFMEIPSNQLKWTHRSHKDVTVPKKIIPVLRAEGTTRLRTLTSSSNEFNVPESEIDGVMVDVTFEFQFNCIWRWNGYRNENVLEHKQSKPKKRNSRTFWYPQTYRSNFQTFNLRTGKMEKFSGFAFSQESSAGRTIATTSEEELVKKPEKAGN